MTVNLKKLSIEHFKGIKSFTAILDGNARVLGANATGKTTLYDAYLWCLTGKDSLGQADFQIKAIDTDGHEAHNLAHLVAVSFDVDGTNKTYARTYKEKWTKKRGKAKAKFTGHTTVYEVNGLPVKMKEFDADVAKTLAENGMLRVMTDPLYFSTVLGWSQRRELLFGLCDDVSELDIIENDPALHDLKDIVIAGKQTDNIRKKIAADKKAVNDELEHIPARIDELLNQVVPIKGTPPDIDTLRKKHADISAHIGRLDSADSLHADIENKKLELRQAEIAQSERRQALNQKYIKIIEELDHDIDDAERKIADLNQHVETHTQKAERLGAQLEVLRAEYASLVSERVRVDATCPTCGQALPRESVADAVKQLQRAKERAIEDNKKTGIDTKAEQKKCILARDEGTGARADLLKQLDTWYQAIAEQKEQWEAAVAEAACVGDADRQRIAKEIDALEIAMRDGDASQKKSALKDELQAIDCKIQDVAMHKATVKKNKQLQDRVAELEKKEKSLGAEYERLERLLFLLEQLTRTKVSMIEESINSRFAMVNFKLFSEQINGGLKECCEATIDGVPYGSVNHAGRIQAGMDIINTLQAAHGKSLPIWVDGRESVIDLMPTEAQTISLIVDAKHDELEVTNGVI